MQFVEFCLWYKCVIVFGLFISILVLLVWNDNDAVLRKFVCGVTA